MAKDRRRSFVTLSSEIVRLRLTPKVYDHFENQIAFKAGRLRLTLGDEHPLYMVRTPA